MMALITSSAPPPPPQSLPAGQYLNATLPLASAVLGSYFTTVLRPAEEQAAGAGAGARSEDGGGRNDLVVGAGEGAGGVWCDSAAGAGVGAGGEEQHEVAEEVTDELGRAAGAGGRSPLTTWTIIRHDGPNHLGLRCEALLEKQMALITSGCALFRRTGCSSCWLARWPPAARLGGPATRGDCGHLPTTRGERNNPR